MAGPDVWETCRELIQAGCVFAFLAEHREALFPPSMFADMYPSSNGRPSLPPQVLAATVVLQSLQGLSDFETVQELRCDLRWKAACGLGLYDTAFDPSLLTYFRRRLRHSADPTRIFTKVKEVVAATGVLKGRQRRALDSTVLDDAVATQDTVTEIISAIRRVIRDVPGAQEVAEEHCRAHDYTDPGKPKIAWNDEQARAALVDALVTDALNLLGTCPSATDAMAAGASPGALRPTGLCPPSIPTPGTSTKTAPATRTDSKDTSPSSRRAGCSPPSLSPAAMVPATTKRPLR
jgi:hypothetical protein